MNLLITEEKENEPIYFVPLMIGPNIRNFMKENFDAMNKIAIYPWHNYDEPNVIMLKEC